MTGVERCAGAASARSRELWYKKAPPPRLPALFEVHVKILSPPVVLACLCLLGSATAAASPAAQAATPGAKAGTATAKAHALDGLAPLTWFEVPNSAVSTSGAMYQYPTGVFFGNSPHIRFFDESGASYDSQRNRMVVFGGGHADYAGNEIMAFDIETLPGCVSTIRRHASTTPA